MKINIENNKIRIFLFEVKKVEYEQDFNCVPCSLYNCVFFEVKGKKVCMEFDIYLKDQRIVPLTFTASVLQTWRALSCFKICLEVMNNAASSQ